jgi:hypothetical protein
MNACRILVKMAVPAKIWSINMNVYVLLDMKARTVATVTYLYLLSIT